jgi:hypothetical protein
MNRCLTLACMLALVSLGLLSELLLAANVPVQNAVYTGVASVATTNVSQVVVAPGPVVYRPYRAYYRPYYPPYRAYYRPYAPYVYRPYVGPVAPYPYGAYYAPYGRYYSGYRGFYW